MAIHPTAIIDPRARIAESADIGPYCIVNCEVEIGPRTRLMANTRRMVDGLTAVGLRPIATQTPILPVVVGTFDVTLKVWRTLFEEDDIFVQPVPPPAVPPNGCRLRLSMTAEHTHEQIDRVVEALARAVRRHAPDALQHVA